MLVLMQPGMNRRSRKENANPRHGDKRRDEQRPYDPAGLIIDPIHHGRPHVRLAEHFSYGSMTSSSGIV
jgi:hypothetical protein